MNDVTNLRAVRREAMDILITLETWRHDGIVSQDTADRIADAIRPLLGQEGS